MDSRLVFHIRKLTYFHMIEQCVCMCFMCSFYLVFNRAKIKSAGLSINCYKGTRNTKLSPCI